MILSFQNYISHHIDDNIGEYDNFQEWNYMILLVLEENELDTYISGEVSVPEGDEAKPYIRRTWSRLRGSPYTTSVFSKDT